MADYSDARPRIRGMRLQHQVLDEAAEWAATPNVRAAIAQSLDDRILKIMTDAIRPAPDPEVPMQTRPDIKVGSKLKTIAGVAQVLRIDNMRDMLFTTLGNFDAALIEELPAPDPADLGAVEEYLELAGQVIARAQIVAKTVACTCDCRDCYSLRHYVGDDEAGRFHFAQNEVCKCVDKRCFCAL